jgi:hypothetical protein
MSEPDRLGGETLLQSMMRRTDDGGVPERAKTAEAKLASLTGSGEPAAQQHLVFQLCQALVLPGGLGEADRMDRMHGAIGLLGGLAPAGEMEGMLAVQMVAVHEAALDCLNRATRDDIPQPFRAQDLGQAAGLCRLFVRQMAALNRNRGRGQQKVRVEHVHVEAGGQAMVGHVENRVEGPGGNCGEGHGGQRAGRRTGREAEGDAR